MDNFYRENILDHYKNPRNFGKLPDSDYSCGIENPLCGDRIGMGIKFKSPQYQSVRGSQKSPASLSEAGRAKVKSIKEIRFYGEGCAISIASASMLTEKVKGMELAKVKKLNMKDILKMLGIELTPTRLKCALLPLEALHKVLAQFDKAQGQS